MAWLLGKSFVSLLVGLMFLDVDVFFFRRICADEGAFTGHTRPFHGLKGTPEGFPQIFIVIYVQAALLRERELPHDLVSVPPVRLSVYLSLSSFLCQYKSCAPAPPNHPSGLSVSSFRLPLSLSGTSLPFLRRSCHTLNSAQRVAGTRGRFSNALVF